MYYVLNDIVEINFFSITDVRGTLNMLTDRSSSFFMSLALDLL